MSFVPTSGTRVIAGQGITASAIGNATQVSANLVGSSSVSITPIGGNQLQLTASAPGTLNTITTGNGSGITATLGSGSANLTSALVAGRGMELLPSGANKNLELKNTLTAGSLNGSGITVSGPVPLAGELRYNVEANLQAGTGVQITNSGANTSKTISNTGVTGLTAGDGLLADGKVGNITITNIGVRQITAGDGISASAGTGSVTLNNTGVRQITAGAGISASAGTGSVTLNNTGILGLDSGNAGSGISITGSATNPIISSVAANAQRSKAFAATLAAPVSPSENVPFLIASFPISDFGSLTNTFQLGISVNFTCNLFRSGGGGGQGRLRFYLQTVVGNAYDPSVSIETYDATGWSAFSGTVDTGGYHAQIVMGAQTGSGFIYLLGVTNADSAPSPFTCNSCFVNIVGSTSTPVII